MTILEAAAALRARKLSSAELVSAALQQIERTQGKLNAFLAVTRGAARAHAQECDAELARGTDRGPLHGIPVAVKDVFCTKGVTTTGGSKLYASHVPEIDAAVVERLHAAGAVLLGKTGLHEFAYGITSNNPHFGPVRNPWDTECVPGGSSGGSGAAVAADMAFMAMGTDTGGSIRIPASYCGTVGLKPTFGRVSRYGVLPLDFSLDHMGPLTRSVRDAAVTLNAIAGRDHRDDTSSHRPVVDFLPGEHLSLRGVRVGVPENYFFEHIHADVERAVRGMTARAEELGAEVVAVRVPDVAALNAVGRVILLSEASSVLGQFADKRDQIGADVLALFDQGRLIAATDYVNAQRLRRVFQREFAKVWEQADVLFTPTTPTSAPKIGQTTTTIGEHTEDVRLMATKFMRGINVLGWPALAMPCGLDTAGMPVSLQILGKPFEEARILRVGAALEDASGPYPTPPMNFL